MANNSVAKCWSTTLGIVYGTGPCPPARILTLQAEPVGAVFGVEQHATAVLATVAGGWGGALTAAPVGAFSAAR